MASKKIVVSDGNGKYQELSSSFSVDGSILSASSVVVTTASYGGSVGPAMQIFSGNITPFNTTSSLPQLDENGNQVSTLSGSVIQFRADDTSYPGFGPHRVASASFSGDIIGTVSSSSPVKVISVGNVTGGVLQSLYGGTNTSSFGIGAIVTTSGSGPSFSDDSNKVVAVDATGNFVLADNSLADFTPMTGAVAYLYTGSAGTVGSAGASITGSWSKPSGCRFVRVICQGGGGGGAGGSWASTAGNSRGGTGGAGGGFADVIFNAFSISNTVQVTAGGGGGGSGQQSGLNGTAGGSSSFGSYLTSSGGSGGLYVPASNNSTTGVAGANGYNFIGGAGGFSPRSAGPYVGGNISNYFGGPGGGTGGDGSGGTGYKGGNLTDLTGGSAGIYTGVVDGGSGLDAYGLFFNNYYLNGVYTSGGFPKLRCSGGGGGGGRASPATRGGTGGSATFGGGGGGGGSGNGASIPAGNGGSGGKGYVLIICW